MPHEARMADEAPMPAEARMPDEAPMPAEARMADEASLTGEPWMTGEPWVAPKTVFRTSAMARTAMATIGSESDTGCSNRQDQRRHGCYDRHEVLQR